MNFVSAKVYDLEVPHLWEVILRQGWYCCIELRMI